MESMLASPADAATILKLYELRTETVMRQARAWVLGEFWPQSADEFFAVMGNFKDPHNAWLRQVTTYWEMAAALVLHGAVSADLFMDTNGEGLFLLAKFAPILDAIREKNKAFMLKTSQLVERNSIAATRYEFALKSTNIMRNSIQR
jgi:hypothetical protein